MANLNEVNEVLAVARDLEIIEDEEFAVLEWENRPRNLNIPYWQYDKFDFEQMNEDECKAEFRFKKADIFDLQEIFHFPEELIMYNRLKVDTTEANCTLLKGFAYPCRYSDMVSRFAKTIPELCVISNKVMGIFIELFQQKGFEA